MEATTKPMHKITCMVCANCGVGKLPTRFDGREFLTWLLTFVPANGMKNQFIDIGEIEFFLDAGAIDMNCLETHIHLFGNLSCAITSSQQLKHLKLAVAQGFNYCRLVARVLNQFLREHGIHCVAEIRTSLNHRTNGVKHLVGGLTFHDVTSSPSAHGTLGVKHFIVH